MSCVPYVWQYCWKEISAVAYIFHLVHCLLRHEITLHVLCRDKFSTSMQQFCHPGNNSYKQEPYSFQAYMHTNGDGPNQMLNNASLLLRFGASSNRGEAPTELLVASAWCPCPPPPKHTPPSPLKGKRGLGGVESKCLEQTSQVPQHARKGLESCSPQYLCCILLRKPYSSDIPRIDRLIRL